MRTLPSAGGQSGYNQGLAVAPNGKVYLGYNSSSVFTSIDNGMNWVTGNYSHEDVHKIHVYSNALCYHVSDGGIFRSTNQGIDWMTAGKLPLSQSYHLTADLSDPNHLWTGLQDNGLMEGFDDFYQWTALGCCDGGDYIRMGDYQYTNVVGHWSRYSRQ